MYCYCSIIIFSIDLGLELFEASHDQVSIFTFNRTIVVSTHGLHYLFLSASLQSWLVVDSVPKVSLIELSHFSPLLFWKSVQILCSVFAEEIIAVEDIVAVDEKSCHPDRSHTSQPPSVCLDNEVGIIKHSIIK